MNKLFVLFLTAIISTPALSQNYSFEIKGTVTGFKDSAYMKLYDFATGSNVFMDSAIILDGKFTFKGAIKSSYQKLGLIYTWKTQSGYKSDVSIFWVQPGTIHFTGEANHFHDAQITGSPMQEESNHLRTLVDQHPDNRKETYIAYIRQHPNSLIAAEILEIYCKSWGKDTIQALYNNCSEKVKQSPFGKSINNYLTLNKNIQIGSRFVDITLPNSNGKLISLSDYKNKYVLLDFWGSWCGPCRQENPNLVKTYHEFKNKNFDILGISVETSKEWWTQAMKQDSIAWECLSDLKGQDNTAVLIYGIDHFPANFLIDPNGIIIAKDLRGDALRTKLAEILK